jgi:hypothetical protein
MLWLFMLVVVFVFFLHFLFPAGEREKVKRHERPARQQKGSPQATYDLGRILRLQLIAAISKSSSHGRDLRPPTWGSLSASVRACGW